MPALGLQGVELRLPCGQVGAHGAAETPGALGHGGFAAGQQQQAVRDVAPLAQRQPAIEIVLGQPLARLPQGAAELLGVMLLPDRVEGGSLPP